jgi:hypothetical protein
MPEEKILSVLLLIFIIYWSIHRPQHLQYNSHFHTTVYGSKAALKKSTLPVFISIFRGNSIGAQKRLIVQIFEEN